MLQKLNNKKGQTGIIEGVFCIVVLGMVVGAFTLTDNHRTRKAIKICKQQGGTQEACEVKVSQYSANQIKSYIKDDNTPGVID